MYTPDEIRNVEFTKSLGGYKTGEVDDFIDKCADTVEALMKEKAELSKKLEVLADKLVEYRNDEDSIRTALLSAQRLGDTVVREANHKAGLILDDANIKAQKIHETAEREIQAEKRELERIQKEVSNFKARMLSIYREHLELIKVLPEEEQGKSAPAVAVETQPVEEAPAVQPAVAAEPAPAPEEPVVEDVPVKAPVMEEPRPVSAPVPAAEPVEQTRFQNVPQLDDEGEPVPTAAPAENSFSSRFTDIKFGEDYHMDEEEEEPRGFFKRKK